MWVKFEFARGKMYGILVCGPTEDDEENEILWGYYGKVGNGYRLCMGGRPELMA